MSVPHRDRKGPARPRPDKKAQAAEARRMQEEAAAMNARLREKVAAPPPAPPAPTPAPAAPLPPPKPIEVTGDRRKAALEARRMQEEAALANKRALDRARAASMMPPVPPAGGKAKPAAPALPTAAPDPRKLAAEAKRMREEALAANKRAVSTQKVVYRPGNRPIDAWGRDRALGLAEPGVDQKMSSIWGAAPPGKKPSREQHHDRGRRSGSR